MDVELRHLRVVVLVAESGSVGRAARSLKVSQPSLTAQLKRIETAFGGRLFDRSHTGVTPTPLGRFAVERARTILADVDHLTATVRDDDSGGAQQRSSRRMSHRAGIRDREPPAQTR